MCFSRTVFQQKAFSTMVAVAENMCQQNGGQTYIKFQQILFQQKAKWCFSKMSFRKSLIVLQVGQFFPSNN
jgi:hypothetical protein